MTAGVRYHPRSSEPWLRWTVPWVPILILALGWFPARADDSVQPMHTPVRAHVTLIGPAPARASVHDVIAELLQRQGIVVSWATQQSFQPQALFTVPAQGDPVGIAVWIDLAAPTETRLYFRDAGCEWFVIRSLSIPAQRGFDEMAKEEVGHVVASAVVALGAGSGKALTRSEAESALQPEQKPNPVAPTNVVSAPGARLALSAFATLQAFSHSQLASESLGLAFEIGRGPRWGPGVRPLGAWLDLGYQVPATYEEATFGVDLRPLSLRAGLLWNIEQLAWVRFVAGLGGGVDVVTYQPHGDSRVFNASPEGRFLVPAAAVWSGLDLRLREHIALTLRALADVALVRVHYDVGNGGGQSTRVLVPYGIRPGISLGGAIIF